MSDKNFTTHGNEPIEARIVAWVLGEASAFEAEELQRLCEEQLASFKKPRRLERVDALPRTAATGQVQRTLLVESIASG